MDKRGNGAGPVFWPYVSLLFIIGLLVGLSINAKDSPAGAAYINEDELNKCGISIDDQHLSDYIQANYEIKDCVIYRK